MTAGLTLDWSGDDSTLWSLSQSYEWRDRPKPPRFRQPYGALPRHCFSDLPTRVGCWGQAGCMGRGDLTNAEWDRLESFLPPGGARGGRWSDHRRVINGVLYRVRTGVQWRDLPERFGPWETVYKRHRRWSADGTWQMLLSRIQTAEDAGGRIDWDVSVDSTAVRAPRPPGPCCRAATSCRLVRDLRARGHLSGEERRRTSGWAGGRAPVATAVTGRGPAEDRVARRPGPAYLDAST